MAEPSSERQARRARRCLSRAETLALLDMRASGDGKDGYRAVLAAVVRAVARETGEPAVWVDLEGHGREELFDEVDPSRTVGWFTALYPVVFDAGSAATPATFLTEVETVLGRVPDGGLGYGLLRYCCPDPAVRARMAAVPRPAVSFNYLGRLGRLLGEGGGDGSPLFRPVAVPEGTDRAAVNTRPYRWEFSAALTDEVLTVHLSHADEPIRADRLLDCVIDTLRALAGTRETAPDKRKQGV